MTKWQEKLKGDPTPWLVESNAWTVYRTLIDVLEMPPMSNEVITAKNALNNDPSIKSIISKASEWFPQSITRHNDPKICYYQLRMLADFGLTIQNKYIHEITDKVMQHSEEGLFTTRQVLPDKGKGFSKPDPNADEWHALPCDSPLITYSLLRLGLNSNMVKKSVDTIKEKWASKPGWFCHFFFVESQFKKIQVGCPMAGLIALEVFSQIPELKESVYAQNAFAPLKFHREYGKSVYYFGRSKKFWTLKYPFVWYNALYLADVLTRFEFLKGDELVGELIEWIENSQDKDGRFKPNSMFMVYKGWDFANKKEPSPWITFLCCRILKRWYG